MLSSKRNAESLLFAFIKPRKENQMAKMIKGFALVACVGAVALFSGCGKESKYKSLLEERKEIALEKREIEIDKMIKTMVNKFKDMKEGEKAEAIDELKEEVKKEKKELEEMKK
jgi:superfamily I DNA/RNA helicase